MGQKKPNDWGLYDMHGNVWEWVQDWWDEYRPGSEVDPWGPSKGDARVLRGGCWSLNAENCRSATRRGLTPLGLGEVIGFRLALEAEK